MATTVDLYVPNTAVALATYASLQLFTDTTPGGAFTTQVGSDVPIVSGTNNYAVTHSSGGADTWYRWRYANTGAGAFSSLSEAFRASGTTLLRLRMEAAIMAGAGFAGTCSADGTTTTLVDAVLGDTGVGDTYQEGAWIYRPNAALASDMCRRVALKGFNTTAPTSLTVTRAWTNAPASAEVYQIFNLQPPIDQAGTFYSWDRAVREGLREIWFVDRLNLGLGTVDRDTRFSLAGFGDLGEPSIRRVFAESVSTLGVLTDVDYSTLGQYWDPIEQNGALAVNLYPAPFQTQSVLVEVVRRDAALYADADVTLADYECAWRSVVWKMFARVSGVMQPGKYAAEMQAAQADFMREYERIQPRPMISGV